MPLSWRHFWIAGVTGLGQLAGTAVATIAGIIIPMLNILGHPELPAWLQGLIGAADLIGIMVGSVLFGRLSDRYGYLPFFRLSAALIAAAAAVAALLPGIWILVGMLFIIGVGIGGEYSLDSDYDSVLMPSRWAVVMLGVTKSGAGIGNVLAAGGALLLAMHGGDASRWPELMWIIAGIGGLMLLTRIHFFESPKWLAAHGKPREAGEALRKFLGPRVDVKESVKATDRHLHEEALLEEKEKKEDGNYWQRNRDRIILTGLPWMCEGLGVYGIGVFIPILVMALGIEHISQYSTPMMHLCASIRTTLWISCIILPGCAIGIWLAHRKVSIVKIQSWSFWVCAASLIILVFSCRPGWPKWISLTAFMTFELFLNVGPHLVTYLLPPKVYPLPERGEGTGISAAIGKAGAVGGVFLVPWLLKAGGSGLVLGVSAAVMAFGAIVTAVYSRKVFGAVGACPPPRRNK